MPRQDLLNRIISFSARHQIKDEGITIRQLAWLSAKLEANCEEING